jgi:hypothetical protein
LFGVPHLARSASARFRIEAPLEVRVEFLARLRFGIRVREPPPHFVGLLVGQPVQLEFDASSPSS